MIETIFILSLILNVVLGYLTYNLIRKLNVYEDFVVSLHQSLRSVLASIRAIDIRGAFEHDDEVGATFKGIRGMIETLNEFLPETDDKE